MDSPNDSKDFDTQVTVAEVVADTEMVDVPQNAIQQEVATEEKPANVNVEDVKVVTSVQMIDDGDDDNDDIPPTTAANDDGNDDDDDDDVVVVDGNHDDNADRGDEDDEPEPPQKKRGRPRKDEVRVSVLRRSRPAPGEPPRKRGRPSKSSKEPKEPKDNEDDAEEAENVTSLEENLLDDSDSPAILSSTSDSDESFSDDYLSDDDDDSEFLVSDMEDEKQQKRSSRIIIDDDDDDDGDGDDDELVEEDQQLASQRKTTKKEKQPKPVKEPKASKVPKTPKEKKPKAVKEPKVPKEKKPKVVKEPKTPKEKKPKVVKEPKTPKERKSKTTKSDDLDDVVNTPAKRVRYSRKSIVNDDTDDDNDDDSLAVTRKKRAKQVVVDDEEDDNDKQNQQDMNDDIDIFQFATTQPLLQQQAFLEPTSTTTNPCLNDEVGRVLGFNQTTGILDVNTFGQRVTALNSTNPQPRGFDGDKYLDPSVFFNEPAWNWQRYMLPFQSAETPLAQYKLSQRALKFVEYTNKLRIAYQLLQKLQVERKQFYIAINQKQQPKIQTQQQRSANDYRPMSLHACHTAQDLTANEQIYCPSCSIYDRPVLHQNNFINPGCHHYLCYCKGCNQHMNTVLAWYKTRIDSCDNRIASDDWPF